MTGTPPEVERLLTDYYDSTGLDALLQDEEEALLGAVLRELRLLTGRADFIEGSDLGAHVDGSSFTPQNWNVADSDVLDDVPEGGAVALDPGDDKALVRVEPERDAAAALAVGAKDKTDVQFYLRVDGDQHHRKTNSPLGTINSPYSFIENGGYVPVENSVEYRANYLDDSTGGTVETAARIIWFEP